MNDTQLPEFLFLFLLPSLALMSGYQTPATKMEDSGIFLFKSSKNRVSTESIFIEEKQPQEKKISEISSSEFVNGKWMKKFLLKFSNPSLLKKSIIPISIEQLTLESKLSLPCTDGIEVVQKLIKVKKITRGNRRHKIKTRKQRRLKTLKK